MPPVGLYSKRFGHIDPEVGGPLYGTHATWGGSLKKQSLKIKENDFKKKVHACSRLDRTLVYVRKKEYEFNKIVRERQSTG